MLLLSVDECETQRRGQRKRRRNALTNTLASLAPKVATGNYSAAMGRCSLVIDINLNYFRNKPIDLHHGALKKYLFSLISVCPMFVYRVSTIRVTLVCLVPIVRVKCVSTVHIMSVARVHCSYNVGVLCVHCSSFICVSRVRHSCDINCVHCSMFLCCAFIVRVTCVCRLSHVTFVCCASTIWWPFVYVCLLAHVCVTFGYDNQCVFIQYNVHRPTPFVFYSFAVCEQEHANV